VHIVKRPCRKHVSLRRPVRTLLLLCLCCFSHWHTSHTGAWSYTRTEWNSSRPDSSFPDKSDSCIPFRLSVCLSGPVLVPSKFPKIRIVTFSPHTGCLYLHPYTPPRQLRLPQSPLPTSYQHCSCLSWFSTCWPFPLEFPPSLSQICRLLHCLQSQSKNSTLPRGKHLWPLTISIHALLTRHNNVDFCVFKLN